MSKPKPKPGGGDPLIAALIAKLPPAGRRWPAADRGAWLRMMSMCFAVVYGAEDTSMDDGLDIPKFLQRNGPERAPIAAPVASSAPPASPSRKTAKAAHLAAGCDYYVDPHGFVRCDTQKDADGLDEPTPQRRVLPEEVEGEAIYEYRSGPARNRETVVWADDSTGAPASGMVFCGPG